MFCFLLLHWKGKKGDFRSLQSTTGCDEMQCATSANDCFCFFGVHEIIAYSRRRNGLVSRFSYPHFILNLKRRINIFVSRLFVVILCSNVACDCVRKCLCSVGRRPIVLCVPLCVQDSGDHVRLSCIMYDITLYDEKWIPYMYLKIVIMLMQRKHQRFKHEFVFSFLPKRNFLIYSYYTKPR